jgi:aryl-alcohol dehydrogenase-like predicted oxidoreductase
MNYVRLGNRNLKVSCLCLGTMGMGSKSWRSWVLDKDESAPIIHRALDKGINFFDTCDFYSTGESERILGEALLKQVPRDSIVLATKAGNPMQPHCNGRGYSRKHLREAVDASLKRLGTDYIDLFQTHIWDPATDLEELVDAFGEIVRSGKALYVGATTMPAWSFATAIGIATAKGLASFVSMQCEYNPTHRECEREMLDFCRHAGLAVIPFSPMGRGFLSADRRLPDNETERTRTDDYTRKHYYRLGDFAVLDAVRAVGAHHGISASQVALAWTLARPGVTSPIIGPTKIRHIDEAVDALNLKLDAADVATINAAYIPRPLDASGH